MQPAPTPVVGKSRRGPGIAVGAESLRRPRPEGPARAWRARIAGGTGSYPVVGKSRRGPGIAVGAESLRRPRPERAGRAAGADRRWNRLLPCGWEIAAWPRNRGRSRIPSAIPARRAGRGRRPRIAGGTGSYPRPDVAGESPAPRTKKRRPGLPRAPRSLRPPLEGGVPLPYAIRRRRRPIRPRRLEPTSAMDMGSGTAVAVPLNDQWPVLPPNGPPSMSFVQMAVYVPVTAVTGL